MRTRSIPFVVGNWVQGTQFYGRQQQLNEILQGGRKAVWLLGTRRSGKTSTLRQLEHLAESDPEPVYFPFFWDLQGAEDGDGLQESWHDALLDAEDRLEENDIEPEELNTVELFSSLRLLRRQVRNRGLRLLMLCDEVEELIRLDHHQPQVVRRLRRALQSPSDVHCVLAASLRLWSLAESQHEETSPFLSGFTPPMFLDRMSDDTARALVRQEQLPAEARPRLAAGVVEEIVNRCDSQPYLMQMLAKRTMECGDLVRACEEVASDQMVSHFFAVDLDMLSQAERRILALIAEESVATSGSIFEQLEQEGLSFDRRRDLFRLEKLGYLNRQPNGDYVLTNYFFRRWLRVALADRSAHSESTSANDTRPIAAHLDLPLSTQTAVLEERYRLLEKVSEGSYGYVFRARDELLDVQIAIKLLKPELTGGSDEPMLRLRREILLSRDLAHPNIVRTYHMGTWRGRVFLTMQWVSGPTLKRVIREEAPLNLDMVLAIGRQLASALVAAHDRQVIHRDLKPENILMADGDIPMIADFGLARIIGEPGRTAEQGFIGTPKYASPEQANQGRLDERSDLYNLGLILYELATGRTPFCADTSVGMLLQHSVTPAPDPRQHKADLPEALVRTVLHCLEKKPQDRIQSARQLRDALRQIENDICSGPHQPVIRLG